MIRGTSLQGFCDVVSGLGGDPDVLLDAAGIDPMTVGSQDDFIAFAKVVSVIEAAAQSTRTPDFGRRLARRQGIEILGAVGVAGRTARTMGEGLGICGTYLAAYSPSVAVSLDADPATGQAFLEYRIVDQLPVRPDQKIELSLGIALNVCRHLAGAGYTPVAVHVPHPPLGTPDAYREYFGCRVHFNQPSAGLVLRINDLASPLAHDALAHAAVVRYLETVIGDQQQGVTRPVRDLISRLLPTGVTTMDVVAKQMAVHPKTLQRRLADEGATFAGLLDTTRRERAERYLLDSELGMTQIARQLGYSEQSALTRSCKRWFGEGPAAIRARVRHVPDSLQTLS